MRRTALLGALLVTVLAGGMAISTPKPVDALLLQCCVGYYQTAQYWAKGATCAEAQANYRALARPEADAFCGGSTYVCAFSIPQCEDWSSVDPYNPWKLDNVSTFGCKEYCERDPYQQVP